MSEHEEQKTIIAWVHLNEKTDKRLRWLMSIPNGAKLPFHTRNGKRYSPQAYFLIAEGMRAGVADLFLPVPVSPFHGLWIEMKYGDNKLTDLQKEFLADMLANGYQCRVCWSSGEAIDEIQNYLAGNTPERFTIIGLED